MRAEGEIINGKVNDEKKRDAEALQRFIFLRFSKKGEDKNKKRESPA